MNNVTVVIRVDAGAITITPTMVEEAINSYLGSEGAVTVFHATQSGQVETEYYPYYPKFCETHNVWYDKQIGCPACPGYRAHLAPV
jgi:hypothetical protein